MIGPLIKWRRLEPRSSAEPPGLRRRVRNIVTVALEACVVPLARWEKETLVTERVPVAIADLAPAFEGYRIAFLSDLHASALVPRWWLDRAVAQAVALEPHLIVLGGDFVDDDYRYVGSVAEILKPLHAPDGVFAVLGNHDHYVDAPGVRAALKQAGVIELYNRSVVIHRGAAGLAVAGVGDLKCDVIAFEQAVHGLPSDTPVIALSHWPDVFAYWPSGLPLDLMLSGHTHGGQAFLPFIGPPFVPSQFGARYLAGLFREGERQLYVTRGVGASGVPVRWGCPPELTLVTLHTS